MRFKGPKTKILVVAAHPDDEVLGCAGTIARLAREGHETHILILGEGITSRYEKSSQAEGKLVQQLHGHARAVGKLLGARSVSFERFPDNRFDGLPLLKIVKKVEKQIEQVRPEVVFTHHPGDLNVDHRAAFQAVLTASRPVNGCPVRDLYTFEIASSTEWAFQQIQPVFRPNVFVDISATVEKKLQGMQLYKGEVRSFPHPRSLEALRAIARRWGAVVGLPYAEAFELVRSIR